jgi:hypothetical protein
VAVERGQHLVKAAGVLVVQRQPHPNAAICRFAQRIKQQRPGEIVAPNAVLQNQIVLGRAHHEHTRGKGVQGAAQRVNIRKPDVRLALRPIARFNTPGLSGVTALDTRRSSGCGKTARPINATVTTPISNNRYMATGTDIQRRRIQA